MNTTTVFCAGSLLMGVLSACTFKKLRELQWESKLHESQAINRNRRQKHWLYSADGCVIHVTMEANVFGHVPEVYLHAAAAWATKTVLDAAALRENAGEDKAGKPLERRDDPAEETPPARVEGADSLAGYALAKQGAVRAAEGLDGAAVNHVELPKLGREPGVVAGKDEGLARLANPPKQRMVSLVHGEDDSTHPAAAATGNQEEP